jgi:hypothetical protein
MPRVDRRAGRGAEGAEHRSRDGAEAVTPARRAVGLGLVLLCLGGTLLIGAAHKALCIGPDWTDGRQYRLACYTDITPLFVTEQLADGRLPYLQPCAPSEGNCDEYPVLTMYFMRLAGWASDGGMTRFFWANAVLLAVCATATAVGLYVLDARRALWFALAPSLAALWLVNWDLLAVALAAAATVAFFRRRDGWAGALLGLGAAAKLYPVLLLLPLVAERLRQRHPDRAIVLGWTAAGTWIAVNLPFAVLGTRGWWEFLRFSRARPADWDSGWYIACRQLSFCPSTDLINAMSLAALVGLVAVIWVAKRRREPGFPRWQLVFPIVATFLLVGKVYSPQFSLWVLPWLALTVPNLRRFIAFEVADLAVFLTRFSFFGEMTGFGGLPQWAFETAVMVRAAVLVWCVVAWVREPSRHVPLEGRSTEAIAMDAA